MTGVRSAAGTLQLPKPSCYRQDVKCATTGHFLRYAYYQCPPGVPMFTEGQVRAVVEAELRKRGIVE